MCQGRCTKFLLSPACSQITLKVIPFHLLSLRPTRSLSHSFTLCAPDEKEEKVGKRKAEQSKINVCAVKRERDSERRRVEARSSIKSTFFAPLSIFFLSTLLLQHQKCAALKNVCDLNIFTEMMPMIIFHHICLVARFFSSRALFSFFFHTVQHCK